MSVHEVVTKYSLLPFRFGFDCCTFVGDCLDELGRENPMHELTYGNEREAMKIIAGHGSLRAAITHYFGEPIEDEPADGDVALVEYEGREVAGLVLTTWNGARIILRTEKGVTDWAADRALCFWRPSCV